VIRGHFVAVAVAAAVVCGCAGAANDRDATPAAGERGSLSVVPVARGLDEPVHVSAPRSEPGRLYVVEQGGRIRIVENGRVRSTPFLDIRERVQSGGEQGLLSIAFHPRYATNHRYYVQYTDRNGDQRVVEYRSNGLRTNPATERRLVLFDDPYGNHNGGQLAFGPDGKLYIGMGDGGAGGDPENRAQNLRDLHGKLLTINVDRRGARPQISALGLRNPWRFSFDRANGDLYIGDVGQGSWEEIDYRPRRHPGLENYGWSRFEGRARYSDRAISRGRYVPPIAVYELARPHCAVTGGFVYRGTRVAAARGRYFYGDYCSGDVWSLRVVRGRATSLRREAFDVDSLTSFGEDARGELYAVSHGGVVYRLSG
jgi:glucose/arabinose dehydrogenase